MARPFFFMHVMKTGGTTFRDHIRRNFAPEQIYPGPSPPDGRWFRTAHMMLDGLRELPPERRGAIGIYMGHFPFMARELITPTPITLTLLRDPVDRTISILKQSKRDVERHRDQPLEGIYEDPWTYQTVIRNHQAKLFAMTLEDEPESLWDVLEVDAGRLAIAKENLERVEALGLTERFDEFLETVREQFGWRFDQVPNRMVSTKTWTATKSFRDHIAEDNAAEMEFYEHAREVHDRRRRRQRSAVG
jgi:hypothetical protein